jgi:hypothetical protein
VKKYAVIISFSKIAIGLLLAEAEYSNDIFHSNFSTNINWMKKIC